MTFGDRFRKRERQHENKRTRRDEKGAKIDAKDFERYEEKYVVTGVRKI